MKKYLKILLLSALVLVVTACGKDKKIPLPEAKDIAEASITGYQETIYSVEETKIAELIEDLRANSKATRKESVNDQPTDVEDYITIRFHPKVSGGDSTTVYLYEKDGKTYMEEAYVGIWELKEDVFDQINEKTE